MTGNSEKKEAAHRRGMYKKWGGIAGALVGGQILLDVLLSFWKDQTLLGVLWNYVSFSTIVVLASYAAAVWGIANSPPPVGSGGKHTQSALQLGLEDGNAQNSAKMEFHDLLYVTAASQILSNMFSWGWYVYLVAPLYGGYRLATWGYAQYTKLKALAGAMTGNAGAAGAGNANGGGGDSKAMQKKKEQQEKLQRRQKGR